MKTHELGEDLDDAAGANAAGDVDRQPVARPFVNYGEALQRLPSRARVEHKIVRSDRGWDRPGATQGHPAGRLAPRHL